MTGFVGAQHEFHDDEFVRDWASRFAPTEPRLKLFDMILAEVNSLRKANAHVVELGIGPGYMARYNLERNAKISFEAVDFSDVFMNVARKAR